MPQSVGDWTCNMARCINRAAVVVRPLEPYIDWAASQDEEAPIHAKDLARQVSIYLVAQDPDGKKETAPLEKYYEEIFETELGAWTTDKAYWPKTRTLEMFHEWFEVVGESIITDLETSPIRTEEM